MPDYPREVRSKTKRGADDPSVRAKVSGQNIAIVLC